MRHVFATAMLLALAACSTSTMTGPVDKGDYYAGQNLWGTDAHLAPSKPDAILHYADHPRGFAELRLPKGAQAGKGPFPLAVIFHGGCWKTGVATQAYMGPLATRWQELGIATLNVDYREVGDGGGWPGSFEDWNAASELIDQVWRKYPIDRDRVTLVGHSAGALPALWLAEVQAAADAPAGARLALLARGAVIFDGPADLALERDGFDSLCGFPSVDPFMGGSVEQVPERYAAISPSYHEPRLKHVLFVQAKLPAPAERAQQAMRDALIRVDLRPNPGASHFDIITPGAPAYAANEDNVLKVLRGR